MAQWYLILNNKRRGPVEDAQLRGALHAGKIPPETMVWTQGLQGWVPATQIPQLRSAPVPPAAPPQPSSPYASTYEYDDGGFAPGSAFTQKPVLLCTGGSLGRSDSYAGFWKRFVALIIDRICVGIAGGTVGFVFGLFLGASGNAANAFGMSLFLGLIVEWLYYAFFESSSLQATPGKMALGIVVTDMDGNRVGFGKASGRHWGKLISGLIMGIGYLMAGFSERKQALHDMMAGCLVVNK